MSKKNAIFKIQQLVDYYSKNADNWEVKSYKEAQTREDFIDNFFEALGWKISGIPTSKLPVDRDVLVEYSLKNKSLDYLFKIRNRHQFIVEAKKPSENLDNKKHIFQAKSYGFLSKVPFIILTNFKELKIYDISEKPHINQPNRDLIFQCTYNEYLKNIDYLWNNFSKEAVKEKSLIKLYIERRAKLKADIGSIDYGYIHKKGEELLDSVFLNDLDIIRKDFAQSIVIENSIEFSDKELNELIERLINIILFIRFLEDNKIEDIDLLRDITHHKKNSLKHLMHLCLKLNKKYNGLLFHDYPLLYKIKIDSNIFKMSILKLYYPESPYDFSRISIEILGQIFEKYLAKRVIQENKIVSLEDKYEVRKSGGIYYTPEYIVDNILKNTLNKFLEKRDINLDNFNIAKTIDFSCGSGIFLIKAYKKIIEYFTQNIKNIPSEFLFENSLGEIELTMEAKKYILEENIFGIDIDSQAIEIVKMSLYFTMLENFNEDNSPLPLLPSLDKNIICGNSIVDLSFFDNNDLSREVIELVNPFSWEDMLINHFDIIVGNPPYIRLQLLKDIYPHQYAEFLKTSYNSSFGNFDLSVVFIEKAIYKLSKDGYIGYIVPNKILDTSYGKSLKEIILQEESLSKIINFNDCQIFQDSKTYTCLLFLDRKQSDSFDYISIENVEEEFINKKLNFLKINKATLRANESWLLPSNQLEIEFLNILSSSTTQLKEINNFERIFVGLQPSVNDVFLLDVISSTDTTVTCFSKALNDTHKFENNLIKKLLKGSKNIFKYNINTKSVLLFPYINSAEKSELLDVETLQNTYPLTWDYLLKCKDTLQKKKPLQGKDFYKFIYKKNHLRFNKTKILLPSLCYGSRFALDEKGEYYFTGSGEGGGGGYSLLLNKEKCEYNYYNILALLNSKVISSYIELRGKSKQNGYKGIDKNFIENIPFPQSNTKREKELLKEISIHGKKLNSIFIKNPTTAVSRMIKHLEKKINLLVLEAYNITEKEIIVLIDKLSYKS